MSQRRTRSSNEQRVLNTARDVMSGRTRNTAGMNDAGSQAWTRYEVFKAGERIAIVSDTTPRLLDKYIEDDACTIYESLFLGTDLPVGGPAGQPQSRTLLFGGKETV